MEKGSPDAECTSEAASLATWDPRVGAPTEGRCDDASGAGRRPRDRWPWSGGDRERAGCVRSHVYRTVAKFVAGGRVALLDQRSGNGRRLADHNFDRRVDALVRESPEDHGYPRPTWTRELLILVAEHLTGVRVSLTVMGRVLRRIGARRGRPKPIVGCPLAPRHQRRRLRAVKQLIADLPADEVAVYEDEADVHLNPKIGLDWMARGQQKHVVTPGNNKKAYLAGALDARDGTVLWVGAEKKNSALFVAILDRLNEHYGTAKCIHVVLDNYMASTPATRPGAPSRGFPASAFTSCRLTRPTTTGSSASGRTCMRTSRATTVTRRSRRSARPSLRGSMLPRPGRRTMRRPASQPSVTARGGRGG